MSNRAKIRKRAEQLKGRPVCVTLHDGRTYVGWITGIDKDGLTLSKPRKNKNKSKNRKSKDTLTPVRRRMYLDSCRYLAHCSEWEEELRGLPGCRFRRFRIRWNYGLRRDDPKNNAGCENGLQYDQIDFPILEWTKGFNGIVKRHPSRCLFIYPHELISFFKSLPADLTRGRFKCSCT